ncbi:MAG: tetratricopeptide repeat protein [Chloroflexota bacterium]
MSRQDDLQQLIINYGRRLQKLQEQQALMGLDTPPHILIEIEDIQAKMAELQEKLATLTAADFVAEPAYPTPEQQAQPQPPSAPQSGPRPPTQRDIFVGRQAQLADLERYWQEAYHQQRGKVVFLAGEAGIGKTRLVREFSQAVLPKYPRMQYAYAQCDQIAGDISPYAPFVQLLNKLTEQATRRGRHWSVEFIREIGPDILNMVPVAGPILATAAKSADFAWRKRRQEDDDLDRPSRFSQQDIFQQFTDTFRNLARHKSPLLLFIDDWHWADTSSTNLLFHLARQLSDVPILLLAAYRPHDAQARQHPILAVRTEMERYQLCTGLSLDFLSRDDLLDYLARRFLQAQFEPSFIDWLLDITNGNALFTTEYVNLLVNEKLLTPTGRLANDLDQMLPPANVEAVIRSRLGFLDQEGRDMLAYGSVEGEQFTTFLLSRLLDLKPLLLLKRLRTIEETHQLIVSRGQQTVYEQQTTVYRFIHTLIHHTLYNSLEAEERAEINRLLLELRGQIYEQADEATQARLLPDLLSHAAEAQDYLAEARYALAASENTVNKYAPDEVLKQCERGLAALKKVAGQLAEVQRLHIDLLLQLSKTVHFTSKWQQGLETCRQAEALARKTNDKARLAEALNDIGWILRHLGRYDQALHSYNEAMSLAEQLGDRVTLNWANNGIGVIFWRQGHYDQALLWFQKVSASAEEIANKKQMALAYHSLANVYSNRGNYDEAVLWYSKAMAINEEAGNKLELAWNYNNLAIIKANQDKNGEAIEFFRKAVTISQEATFKRGEAAALGGIGTIYKKQGEYEQALNYYRQSQSINEIMGETRGLGWNYNGIGLVYQDLGDYDQALELYQKALTIWQEVGFKREEAQTRYNIGTIHETQARYPQALDYYRRALALRQALNNPKDIAETQQRIAEVEAKLAAKSDS